MALPVKKSTKTRKRRRLAYFKQSKTPLSVCPKCKKPIRSHQACSFCGTYKGREIVEIKIKKAKPGKPKKEEEKQPKT
ncbi:50S ribosomal protein L32 [Patescibacteria group bacterium]|nr:50S ribosomal protein L32 [Patescibacteria group bacterium]MBU1890499.1 50S ribosomal protein L32 [Patescibacteria group bacterium]